MADQWYYASNGQQLGPVDLTELQRLAASGQLQPADLVWKAGMHQWAPAGLTRGLFPGARSHLPPPPAPEPAPPQPVLQAVPVEAAPAPRTAAPRPVGPPRPRSSAPPRTGMSGGAKAALFGGIAAGVIVLVVVIVLVIVTSRGDQGDPAIVNGRGAYTVNLGQQGRDVRWIHFNGGRQVWITVTSDFNTDVDLFVFDQRGAQIASDTRISKDCDVRFWAPRTGLYRVEVVNLGPGTAPSCAVIEAGAAAGAVREECHE